jgi:hypothetical protein
MSKSSVEDIIMDRRSYLPPLRPPYDTDLNYNNIRQSQQHPQPPVTGNQQYFSSKPADRMDRNSGERLSSEYLPGSGDRMFMEELLRRQQRWVMGIMESSFRRITEDVMVCGFFYILFYNLSTEYYQDEDDNRFYYRVVSVIISWSHFNVLLWCHCVVTGDWHVYAILCSTYIDIVKF